MSQYARFEAPDGEQFAESVEADQLQQIAAYRACVIERAEVSGGEVTYGLSNVFPRPMYRVDNEDVKSVLSGCELSVKLLLVDWNAADDALGNVVLMAAVCIGCFDTKPHPTLT